MTFHLGTDNQAAAWLQTEKHEDKLTELLFKRCSCSFERADRVKSLCPHCSFRRMTSVNSGLQFYFQLSLKFLKNYQLMDDEQKMNRRRLVWTSWRSTALMV